MLYYSSFCALHVNYCEVLPSFLNFKRIMSQSVPCAFLAASNVEAVTTLKSSAKKIFHTVIICNKDVYRIS